MVSQEDIHEALCKNKETYNIHSGGQIFIVGSGPSLNEYDLSLLKNEVVIATNSFAEHDVFEKIKPLYYLTADPRLYDHGENGVYSKFSRILDKVSLMNDIKLYSPLQYAFHLNESSAFRAIDANWYVYGSVYTLNEKIRFDKAIPPFGQNILNVALMLAFHLGAKEIILIGFDHGGVVATLNEMKFHFHDEIKEEMNKARRLYSEKELERCMYVHLNQIHEIKRYMNKHEISVCTASENGLFKIFPYVRYSSLFRNNLVNAVRECEIEIQHKAYSKALNKLILFEKLGEYPKGYYNLLAQCYKGLHNQEKEKESLRREERLYGDSCLPMTLIKAKHNLVDHIFSYVDAAPDHECLSLYSKGEWRSYTRQNFKERVLHYASVFASYCPHESLIVFIKKTDFELLTAFIGAIYAGMHPAQISPQTSKVSQSEYTRKIRHILEYTQSKFIFTDSGKEVFNIENISFLTPESDIKKGNIILKPSENALVQFSSGSTGLQKGVLISHTALIKHMEHYAGAIELSENDRIVTWLPLYHDMGLIACYLMPLMRGVPFMLMDPFDWLTHPQVLLDAIVQYRCTLCYLPNFAYHVLMAKCKAVDFTSLRMLINCSEPAKSATHRAFLKKFPEIHETQLAVCYALAENTFAVSQTKPGAIVLTRKLHGLEVLSCGIVIPGTEVEILHADSEKVGEVAIRGETLYSHFFDDQDRRVDGFYPTGDLGVIHNGELYITGRMKDLIIVNGKNIYPQDIEFIVSSLPWVYPGRCVCFGIDSDVTGSEELVVLAEMLGGASSVDVDKAVRGGVFTETGIAPSIVELLPHMSLIKTSSGKISRSRNKELYLQRKTHADYG